MINKIYLFEILWVHVSLSLTSAMTWANEKLSFRLISLLYDYIGIVVHDLPGTQIDFHFAENMIIE